MKKSIRFLFLIGVASTVFAMAVSADSGLEIVATFDAAPANLTVSPAGDIYVTMLPFFDPEPRLYRIDKNGAKSAYPSKAWSEGSDKDFIALDAPLGVQCDRNGILWILDSGTRSGLVQKIVGWDINANSLHRIIHLPAPTTTADSFINDLAVDLDHQAIYISDSGAKCLIVVDLQTGNSRHVLRGHASMMEEKKDLVIDGKPIRSKSADGTVENLHLPVNPLAADAMNEYVYYGPLTGSSLYRIKTSSLRDFALSDEDLAKQVERYSDKPHCDGIGIDRAGNIYITDLANNAVGAITMDRKYQQLVRDDKILRWPDSISYGPDGYFYTLAHQIHRTARMNAGVDESSAPFYIVKFKGLAPGVIGR